MWIESKIAKGDALGRVARWFTTIGSPDYVGETILVTKNFRPGTPVH